MSSGQISRDGTFLLLPLFFSFPNFLSGRGSKNRWNRRSMSRLLCYVLGSFLEVCGLSLSFSFPFFFSLSNSERLKPQCLCSNSFSIFSSFILTMISFYFQLTHTVYYLSIYYLGLQTKAYFSSVAYASSKSVPARARQQ